jgi:hypothetical protein
VIHPSEETVTIGLFCVCEEEWCYCTNRVVAPLQYPPLDVPCSDCQAGKHIWLPWQAIGS